MRSDFSLNTVVYRKSPTRYDVFSVCVSSHSFWTSSSLDVPAGVTQEEGHTGFLIHLLSAVSALNFLARRIQLFLSLVDRGLLFCAVGYWLLYPRGLQPRINREYLGREILRFIKWGNHNIRLFSPMDHVPSILAVYPHRKI